MHHLLLLVLKSNLSLEREIQTILHTDFIQKYEVFFIVLYYTGIIQTKQRVGGGGVADEQLLHFTALSNCSVRTLKKLLTTPRHHKQRSL